jgi:hypothetical protein
MPLTKEEIQQRAKERRDNMTEAEKEARRKSNKELRKMKKEFLEANGWKEELKKRRKQ